jgi:hypothetical protein
MTIAMKRRTASALLVGLLGFPGLAQATTYNFYTINGPPGALDTVVSQIAPDGSLAVGTSFFGGSFQNFTVSLATTPPTVTLITAGLQSEDQLYGVNDAGVVVGTLGNSNGVALFPLTGSLSGSSVVGRTVQPLPTGTDKTAFLGGVNDSGIAVGDRSNLFSGLPYIEHGVVFDVGTATYSNITADAVPASSGFDMLGDLSGINDNGIAVGTYGNIFLAEHAYIYDTQTQTPTLVPDPNAAAVFTELSAINDSGVAAGTWDDASGNAYGILYNTLTDSYTDTSLSFPNIALASIDGIDNRGDLSGAYFGANGDLFGFVALAVPETPTWAMLIAGFAALGVAGARGLRIGARAIS